MTMAMGLGEASALLAVVDDGQRRSDGLHAGVDQAISNVEARNNAKSWWHEIAFNEWDRRQLEAAEQPNAPRPSANTIYNAITNNILVPEWKRRGQSDPRPKNWPSAIKKALWDRAQ
jgi:hypothetical protein